MKEKKTTYSWRENTTNELITYKKRNLCIELQIMIHLKEHNEFMFTHKTFQDREWICTFLCWFGVNSLKLIHWFIVKVEHNRLHA